MKAASFSRVREIRSCAAEIAEALSSSSAIQAIQASASSFDFDPSTRIRRNYHEVQRHGFAI
jgi:hypothetical protein